MVSKCAAAGSAVRFSTLFQPPTAESCSSRPRTQRDGPPYWPVQVYRYIHMIGVCCRNGTEIAHHTVSALLDFHPTYIDVSLDVKNACPAFNSISREAFMPLVRTRTFQIFFQHDGCGLQHVRGHHPPLFWCLSHSDLPSTTLLSQRGTRQGCPLGAQLFALGLIDPLLCSLA